jgi:hypothetical protein
MELKYKTTPESEGGGAVPGCGTIHISEINETLGILSDELHFPFDLNEYVLGSTGKREYSGDIDVVLDTKWWPHGPKELKDNLDELYGQDNVKRFGSSVHLKYPIKNYDSTKQERLPRTGYVQVDFNFGDTAWEKFYHFSAGPESEYKGAHRNLALAAITAVTNTKDNTELDTYKRPITQVRWKWSPKGFMRVQKTSEFDFEHNCWRKKQNEDTLDGPYFDPAVIAKLLFKHNGKPEDLNSLETIIDAVKRNFTLEEQNRVWERMARNFTDWKDGNNFIYPPEIEPYLVVNDK